MHKGGFFGFKKAGFKKPGFFLDISKKEVFLPYKPKITFMTSYLKSTVYPYLTNKIEIYCTPFFDREEIHGILKDYQKLQGSGGVCDLAAYVVYAEKRNLDFNRIRETLLHDIDGRGDECFMPSTRGYSETLTKFELTQKK